MELIEVGRTCGAYTEELRKRFRVIRDRYSLASVPVDNRPKLSSVTRPHRTQLAWTHHICS